ncbi:MAG: UbiA family prenyltransferase [Bacillota bacterium]|nr:UbiA family prenyltransferase [Bacillota bacterium]
MGGNLPGGRGCRPDGGGAAGRRGGDRRNGARGGSGGSWRRDERTATCASSWRRWRSGANCAGSARGSARCWVVYSYTKRFTWLDHLVLGIADGWAPLGGWVAVTGSVGPAAFLLWALVALWVGAFDILYAAQDLEFDRRYGLHSIPARFGLPRAFRIARLGHAAVVLLALAVGHAAGLLGPGLRVDDWRGGLYLAGVAVMAGLLVYEHAIVSPDDLSRLDAAFFAVNGWISVVFFAFTAAATLAAPGASPP